MADGAREVGHVTGTTEINSDQGLEKDNSESETRYPLLLPKGVVLKLKPVANRFPRKAWRQKRSSVLKPLLIQPSPSVQPSFNPGKTSAQSTHSEAPPSKMVVRFLTRFSQPLFYRQFQVSLHWGSVEVRVLSLLQHCLLCPLRAGQASSV